MTHTLLRHHWPVISAIVFWLLIWGHGYAPGVDHCHASEALCAEVKIEIKQDLALERQAFDAHMRINNGLTHIPLENVDIAVWITDEDGNPVQITADADESSARFFMRVDSMTNINSVDGSGSVAASASADIHWLIIPAPGASKDIENGAPYHVGATLNYTIGGKAHRTMVAPDIIFVKPMPAFNLDYFIPSEVYGDDAFTPAVEPPVPFPLGLRITNNGHGTARDVRIESAQPKITENEQGLLIGFNIEGSHVNGEPVSERLRVDFGDIAPGASETARWLMTCSLSGRFIAFDADFTHSDALGGQVTSFIEHINAHRLVHDVQIDIPGRDRIPDFLARDDDVLRVYTSDGANTPVADQSAESSLLYQGKQGDLPVYTLSTPVGTDFIHVRLLDPFNGTKDIHSALRGDGKAIHPDNIWQSKTRDGKKWHHFINLFDTASTGTYCIAFADPAETPEVPVLQYVPDVIAIEGHRISFVVHASGSDGNIPAICADSLPAGAGLSDQGEGRATFDWTPSIGQAGSYWITLTASIGDLTDTQRLGITVRSIKDTDGDGIDDAWELSLFNTLDFDGSGDFDEDGISDLDEYLAGSDPTKADHAPTVPIIIFPEKGGTVAVPDPELIIENSTDADEDPVRYQFELYADAGFTRRVAADDNVVASVGTTAWTLPADLEENRTYHWRTRATDGYSCSLWAYGDFFVNAANDPPSEPMVNFPPDGTHVDTCTPVLEVTGVTDPDNEPVTGTIEIYADASMVELLVSAENLDVSEGGMLRWTADPALTGNTTYYWRALAMDAAGLRRATPLSAFTVDTGNRAPASPKIHSPPTDTQISQTDLELQVANAADADGDGLSYRFEIDTSPAFDSTDKQGSGIIYEGLETTGWHVFGLIEDTTYHWRVCATDAMAQSQWETGRFSVNRENDSPTPPVLKNPGEGAWVGTRLPDLRVVELTDSDSDWLTCRFEVSTEPTFETLVAWGETETPHWTLTTELSDRTRYYWRARVADEDGNHSDWMPTASFFVKEAAAALPTTVDVVVSTDKGRHLDGIRVYAFTASGAYTGVHANTDPEGKAVFDIAALPPGAYQFRADHLGCRFWSDTVFIPENAVVPIFIEEETVPVTISTAAGSAAGVRVYLFSESGAYLGKVAQTNADGQVCFDLPTGAAFLFRADILGHQYWSSAMVISNNGNNAVRVDAGGGNLNVTIHQDNAEPIGGIRVYLFNEKENYLGIRGTTNETGMADIDVPAGGYQIRADYLGYHFWSDPVHVMDDTTLSFEIPHHATRVSVKGVFKDVSEPLPCVHVYLFSDANAYLGQNHATDENGVAWFDLPRNAFRVRADYLGRQYWSEAFTWDDPVIRVPTADSRLMVTAAGRPVAGAGVYVFSITGSYLGINGTTDDYGQAAFRLPEGEYDFRVDYQGSQFWVRRQMLTAGETTPVNLSLGGGTFHLTVATDQGEPIPGVRCYVFSETDAYLGVSDSTDSAGETGFDLVAGRYRFRIDYSGHQFWSDPVEVPEFTDYELSIPEVDIRVDVISAHAPVAEGVRVYLFSSAGAYLGKYAATDETGVAHFDLPTGVTYRFRADILGGHYWSEDTPVHGDANPVIIDADGGRMQVTVKDDAGSAIAGAKVYLFGKNGSYLGACETTDVDGSARFDVPRGSYHLRADYLGVSFWQENIDVIDATDVDLIIPLQSVQGETEVEVSIE
jgi:hypothetical protein